MPDCTYLACPKENGDWLGDIVYIFVGWSTEEGILKDYGIWRTEFDDFEDYHLRKFLDGEYPQGGKYDSDRRHSSDNLADAFTLAFNKFGSVSSLSERDLDDDELDIEVIEIKDISNYALEPSSITKKNEDT